MSDSNKRTGRKRSSRDVWPLWMWFAVPTLVIVIVAALWWAVFSPSEPLRQVPTPTPTSRAISGPATPGPTLSTTLGAPTVTPTVVFLPTLAAPTPTAGQPLTPTVEVTPAPTFSIGDKVVVAGTGNAGLNVRAGAGTGHPRIKTLPDGAVLEIIGGPKDADGYTWYQVRDETGTTGWAVNTYMKAR